MGIFDKVVLEDCYILEGEQVEAYKKRKADEKAAQDKADSDRNERRYSGLEKDNHSKFVGNQRKNPNSRSMSDKEFDKWSDDYSKDERRADRAASKANKSGLRGNKFNTAFDAANRHERRHAAKQKANEACDFIASIDYPYNG